MVTKRFLIALVKLLTKQNKAVRYLKDSDTTELLYGGAAVVESLH